MTNEEALKWFEARLSNGVPMPAARSAFQAAIEALKAQNDIEPLTDIEQRIFLAAMGREEKVCKKMDEDYKLCKDENCIELLPVCRNIERKVKRALWG